MWSCPTAGRLRPSDQYYRALDAVAASKDDTEMHLYGRLWRPLTNLDLRLVCYDLTSTYFEGSVRPSGRFPSRAFGYSRDRRADRPQIVIGLLCTSDGIPVAHHVFSGNTGDSTTLPAVLADLAQRFAVGRICVVADRGLISAANIEAVAEAGFDHLLATRLRPRPHHRTGPCGPSTTTPPGSKSPSMAPAPPISASTTEPARLWSTPMPAPAETPPAPRRSSPPLKPNFGR